MDKQNPPLSVRVFSRRLKSNWICSTLLVFLGIILFSKFAWTNELTPQQRIGYQIFRQGTGASEQPIMAKLEPGDTIVNAALLPCIKCHGPDAKGRNEGGVNSANITWHALTKPYPVSTANNPSRPPYDERLLVRAITLGFDSDGRELDRTMPRYIMSRDDIQGLIAYLKIISEIKEPGVTATSLTLMLILPPAGTFGNFGQGIQEIVSRYFENNNKSGGIYGRQINLVYFNLPKNPANTVDSLSEFIENNQPLALVASYMGGQEQEIIRVLKQKEIPSIGAFKLFTPDINSIDTPIFYLTPGLEGESRALALAYSQQASAANHATIVYRSHPLWMRAAKAIELALQKHTDLKVSNVTIPINKPFAFDEVARKLSEISSDALFFLVPGENGYRLLQSIARTTWQPTLYSPGVIAKNVFAKLQTRISGRLFISWPTLAVNQNPKAVANFRTLISLNNGQEGHYSFDQMHAIAAAKVLVEGLRRAGHDVTRQKLVASLESLYEFSTGLTPNVTFGANRRVGSGGVYVIEIDIESGKEIERHWIKIN